MHTILVIDDCSESLDTVCLMLQDAGYSVVPCAQAARVESMCREISFDMVICDIYMEGGPAAGGSSNLAGIQIIFSLHEAFPKIPIIAMSGWLEEEALQKMKKGGVTEVLSKPFTRDGLLSAVRNALGEWE